MNPFSPTTTNMDSIRNMIDRLDFDTGTYCQEICVRSDNPVCMSKLVDMFYKHMCRDYKTFKVLSTTSYVYNNDQHFFITFEVAW